MHEISAEIDRIYEENQGNYKRSIKVTELAQEMYKIEVFIEISEKKLNEKSAQLLEVAKFIRTLRKEKLSASEQDQQIQQINESLETVKTDQQDLEKMGQEIEKVKVESQKLESLKKGIKGPAGRRLPSGKNPAAAIEKKEEAPAVAEAVTTRPRGGSVMLPPSGMDELKRKMQQRQQAN
jgi:DNA repair exonuclease SbcCD ATPase subunit